ncbi:MAG: Platinum sensitivity protein [Pycnora praestabilis]|nr:MAG: Platinum sensitivity protein [Pycnora praestabilis]
MALAVPPTNDRKRVKVYELRNNDWFDRGTGFCTGQVIHDEPRITVESEDQPERTLLETKISKDDGYQKQQDTLIVWTESNGTDMALSFQEADGCATIWEFVSHVQQQLIALHGPVDDALSDDPMDNFQSPVMLPSPELGNLAEIEQMMRNASSTQPGRESLAKFIIGEEYIPKLIPLVSIAEDLESLSDLHRLCNIMKTLILLNDTAIIEYVVTENVVLGVVGALECMMSRSVLGIQVVTNKVNMSDDPDFPSHKANHRHYLSDESKFKEVVKIEDLGIKKKIHHTYRLQYLKDVVLARILDDPTFSVLNSLIFFNQVDIVQHLQANVVFLKELFGVFGIQEPDQQRKRNAVHFIQQCCAIAKNLQAPARAQLYTNFISAGLFKVITFALRHQDASVRIAGTDILVAMIDHDPAMMRGYIFKSISDKQTPLTDTLIELLLIEVDLGVKAQIADAIKVLLDPQSNSPSAGEGLGRASSDFLSKIRGSAQSNPQTESFIQSFYDDSAKKLFQPLKDLEHRETMRNLTIQDVSLFSHLVEILCFFIRQHLFRSKYFILSEGLATRIAQLLSCPEKHLKLTALKFFRTCVGLQDEFYNRQIMANNLFEPILNIVYETMPRDNLLNSACLELFEFIKRENIKPIILHVVENYREKLKAITYVDTFQNLVLRYDQMKGFNSEAEQNFLNAEEDTQSRAQINGGQRWQGVKEMDAVEEEYFNTSDDEDDAKTTQRSTTNGVALPSLSMKPLVDYPDDDDEGMDTKEDPVAIEKAKPFEEEPAADTSSKKSESPKAATPAPQIPPERLSEKRRREEDEEDELVKLSNSKRRGSSVSSTSSHTSNVSNALRRKKSFTNGKDGLPGKKIAISLAVKTGGNKETGQDDAG